MNEVIVKVTAALSIMLRYLRRKKPKQKTVMMKTVTTVAGKKQVPNGVYFYPMPVIGIQPLSIDDILAPHKDTIAEIVRRSGLSTSDNKYTPKKLIEEVIRRTAEYIHLLPASEDYHHTDPGGLLAHSLEVAKMALGEAYNIDLPVITYPDLELLRRTRYFYAVFVAALLHDIGKVFSDMRVYCVDSHQQWHPRLEPLTVWAVKNNVSSYRVEYRRGRGRSHERSASYVLGFVLTPEAKEYILGCSTDDVFGQIDDAISHYAERDGYISQSLRRADSASTLKDVQGRHMKETGWREHSLSTHFIKSTQRLTPTWSYNKQDSLVWVIGGDVYLTFPGAIMEIMNSIRDMKVSCPSDVNVVYNQMVEQHIIQSHDMQTRTSYWMPGDFTEEEARAVQRRMVIEKKNAKWIALARLKSVHYAFGSQVIPESMPGILCLNKTGDLLLFSKGKLYQPLELTTESLHQQIKQEEEEAKAKAEAEAALEAQRKAQIKAEVVAELEATARAMSGNSGSAPRKAAKKSKPQSPSLPDNNAQGAAPGAVTENAAPLLSAQNTTAASVAHEEAHEVEAEELVYDELYELARSRVFEEEMKELPSDWDDEESNYRAVDPVVLDGLERNTPVINRGLESASQQLSDNTPPAEQPAAAETVNSKDQRAPAGDEQGGATSSPSETQTEAKKLKANFQPHPYRKPKTTEQAQGVADEQPAPTPVVTKQAQQNTTVKPKQNKPKVAVAAQQPAKTEATSQAAPVIKTDKQQDGLSETASVVVEQHAPSNEEATSQAGPIAAGGEQGALTKSQKKRKKRNRRTESPAPAPAEGQSPEQATTEVQLEVVERIEVEPETATSGATALQGTGDNVPAGHTAQIHQQHEEESRGVIDTSNAQVETLPVYVQEEHYEGEMEDRATEWMKMCGSQRDRGVMLYHTDNDRTYVRVKFLAESLMTSLEQLLEWLSKTGMIEASQPPAEGATLVEQYLVNLDMGGWEEPCSRLTVKGDKLIVQGAKEAEDSHKPTPDEKGKAKPKSKPKKDKKLLAVLTGAPVLGKSDNGNQRVTQDPPAQAPAPAPSTPAMEPEALVSEHDTEGEQSIQPVINPSALQGAFSPQHRRHTQLMDCVNMMESHYKTNNKPYKNARSEVDGDLAIKADYFTKNARAFLEFDIDEIKEYRRQVEGEWYYVFPGIKP